MAAGGVPVCLCGGSAKTIPAAEEHLPANLCPLIKSTYGYHVQQSNPFLEMADLVVARDHLRRQEEDVRADGRDAADVRPGTAAEGRRPRRAGALGPRTAEVPRRSWNSGSGTQITDGQLRQAIGVMNRERALRRELAALMKADAPPLTGRQLLDFKSSISGIPADLGSTNRPGQYGSPRDGRSQADCAGRGETCGHRRVGAGSRADDGRADGARRGAGAGDRRSTAADWWWRMENCTGLKPILEDVDADGGRSAAGAWPRSTSTCPAR